MSLEVGVGAEVVSMKEQSDPGAGGSLSPRGGQYDLITAGAEARTIQDPDRPGRILSIGFRTDGGDLTLNYAGGFNQAGETTALGQESGDTLVLISFQVGNNLRWRIVSNDGFTLS